MARRSLATAFALLACAAGLRAQQLQPATTGGTAGLDRALGRLTTNARVLVIAAHPDDEDTELLTLLSRGLGVDAGYLALSRGEGGQNLIGTELGEALGLIRTGELLAARSVDGGRQFFSRGFDFGFSKSLEETLRFWPRDSLLADVLRVIRRFRPQVLVSIFTGTPRDGHGQHQEAGVLARQAFDLLRDSAWGPRKFYRSTFFDTAATTLVIPSGMLDPVAGQSFHQIALASRSLHRSQDMGRLLDMGPSQVRLHLALDLTRPGVADAVERLSGAEHLFEGIDVGLPGGLERYGALVDSARAVLTAHDPGRIVPILAAALGELRQRASADFRAAKEPRLMEALASAAGVVVDAAAQDGRIVGGEQVGVAVTVWNAGGTPVTLDRAGVRVPGGWSVQAAGPADAQVAPGAVTRRSFTVTPPFDAPLSEPYFMVRPRRGALYDWSAAPDSLGGEPYDPPLLVARVELSLAGAAITLEREVSHRFNDQARGEIRRPLFVVPAVGVAVDPEVVVWPTASQAPRTVTVELIHGARARTEGELRLEVPGGWPDVPPQRFVLEGEDTRRSFTFEVRAPRGLRPGATEIHAVALVNGARYERAAVLVDYPHIRPVAYTKDATIRVAAAEIALPPLRRVGYVRGASDMVPEALQAVGVPVAVLSETDLERGDLAQYDAIVIGSRAYETDTALIANNARLLDYARAGGRLIVQYQQYQFVTGRFAPYELSIARPHDRVTDENAPVRILEPAHPLMQTPNRIGEADWQGWVQERGLYFAHDWDPAYHPLLEMGDTGERLQGGLLVSRLGRGLYVYTGISFFRQLPAGVPGAYRLFLNLLGLQPANVP
jgi:LmbE family N-acetylglucosaminyl deacetylase